MNRVEVLVTLNENNEYIEIAVFRTSLYGNSEERLKLDSYDADLVARMIDKLPSVTQRIK